MCRIPCYVFPDSLPSLPTFSHIQVFTDPNAAKAALALRLLKAGSAEEASEILVNGANFLAAVFNEITTPLWLFEEAVAVGEEMGMDSLVKYSQVGAELELVSVAWLLGLLGSLRLRGTCLTCKGLAQ